jgi:hypothetical protein
MRLIGGGDYGFQAKIASIVAIVVATPTRISTAN